MADDVSNVMQLMTISGLLHRSLDPLSNFFKGYINFNRRKHVILLNKGMNMEVLASSTKEVKRKQSIL